MRLDVWRFRCPRCRKTGTALPDDVLPGLGYDLATLAGIVAAYLDGIVSYSRLTALVLGLEQPTAAAPYTLAVAHSPAPTTCFRLLARFAKGSRAWWSLAAVALQARGDYVPPPVPDHLAPKARSQAKRQALGDAWQALDAFRQLADRLGVAVLRWAFVMHHAPVPPADLDRTGWFARPPLPP